ncbi:MAG: DEAD/DEAH box helicase family protein [Thermoplasmatales archaeon]|nr:DEAD/DEAH box helicase family protein [Thermoplasmatales archaeon]
MEGYVTRQGIAPGTMERRLYQISMAEGCIKRSTLIILPTGLGKTAVAAMVAAHVLSSGGRVLLLAPTRPLVDQHSESFSRFLSDVVVASVTGNVPPAKRKEIVATADVVVSTPQAVENDLDNSLYDLGGFGLVIYDEAHRGVGNYAYVGIARHYMGGLSMGMTASPGSDAERINEICGNLGFEAIDARDEDDPGVSPYVYDTHVEKVRMKLPADLEEVIASLNKLLNRYMGELVSLGLANPNWPASTRHMLTIGRSLQARLSSGEKTNIVFRGLAVQSICVKILHAIGLAETQGMTALRNYIAKIDGEVAGRKSSKSSKELYGMPDFGRAREIANSSNTEHPKVSRVMGIVSRALSADPGSKVIVFAQYRDTCDMLEEKLSGMPGARVGKLIGQSKGGLRQREQIELLDRFRAGELNVIVSTSVGEEGLDVANTDAVVFYEPVPSEIRTIQRRGRTGRKSTGTVYVLIAEGTRDEAFERTSEKKETAMRDRIGKVGAGMHKKRKLEHIEKQRSLGDF